MTSPSLLSAADPVYVTLYHRDLGLAALAEAELHALVGGHSPEPGVWLSPRPLRWARCGYGSAGGRQLAFGASLDELEAKLRALKLEAPRFSLTVRRIPRSRAGALAAKRRIGDCITGAVSIADPQLRLLLVVSALGYRVLVEDAAERGEADWLAVSQRPKNYMVALPVRIAMAMLNLTARPEETVLDPFCGSGTIPLVAAWAGHEAYGSDISSACVEWTRENLAHFGLSATLACRDARDLRQQADCIVTNLPYGLYSHIAGDALLARLENLGRLAPRVTLVTSKRIDDALREAGLEQLRTIVVGAPRFERFVYLTRAVGPGGTLDHGHAGSRRTAIRA
jgi:predicted RNA methylase